MLASDRDGWKRDVRRLQAEAKAISWTDSAKEVKQQRKELRTTTATLPPPQSRFTYHAHGKLQPAESSITNEEDMQIFLTGTTKEREALQRAAAKKMKEKKL